MLLMGIRMNEAKPAGRGSSFWYYWIYKWPEFKWLKQLWQSGTLILLDKAAQSDNIALDKWSEYKRLNQLSKVGHVLLDKAARSDIRGMSRISMVGTTLAKWDISYENNVQSDKLWIAWSDLKAHLLVPSMSDLE